MASARVTRRHSRAWILLAAALAVAMAPRVASCRDAALARADSLRLTGHYEEAKKAYSGLSAREPVRAAVGLGRCLEVVGDLDRAMQALSAAAEKQPSAADLPAEMARLEFERGQYEAARKHAEAALQLDQDQCAARFVAAELHRVAGRLEEANDAYRWFIRFYNSQQDSITDPEKLLWIGRAAAQFARWNRSSGQFGFLVNDLYPDALKLDRNYWPAHLEMALLFIEKYNRADARTELDSALAINPGAAEAHAARARLELETFNFDSTRTAIDRALAINPRLLVAHQIKADLQMVAFGPRGAVPILEEARRLDPLDELTLGRLAAAYGGADGLRDTLPGTRMRAVVDEAVGRNPRCGEFFAALAGALDLMGRYPYAARYYEEARVRMPQLVAVPGQLGLVWMRLGDEARAAGLLDEAFKIDPFNVRVKNTLQVLELLKGYGVIETPHFLVKYDRGPDSLLARYAARYLEQEVYPVVTGTFGYQPPARSLFEIFSAAKGTSGHSWFSARMVGLPFIGTVGACAGKMVAVTSPNDLRTKYNWARVVKHEFTHVVNLQQTDFTIPRWFTEALAVRQEGYPHPSIWDRVLARRAAAGTLFNLGTINLGFVRPVNGDDWPLAYCQAELYAEYMAETYGKDALNRMVAAYADRLDTPGALKRSFHVEQAPFEAGYRKFIDKTVAGMDPGDPGPSASLAALESAVRRDSTNAVSQARLAGAYLEGGSLPQARAHAAAALRAQPRHPLAAYVMARVQVASGDTLGALKLLQGALDPGAPGEQALALLAKMTLDRADSTEALRLYRIGAEHFPHDAEWFRALADLYRKSGDAEKLAAALERLSEVDDDDVKPPKELAQLAMDRKDAPAAARWAKRALYSDVLNPDAHAILARTSAESKRYDQAVEEYETALRLDARQPAWRLALAQACVEAKQVDRAREVLKELLDAEPQYPGARKLLDTLK